MRRFVLGSVVVVVTGFWTCHAGTITVTPEKSVIVVPAGTNDARLIKSAAIAAGELAKHLKLITGLDVETVSETNALAGRYPFYVGIVLPGDKKPLAPEEARRVITPEATYLYGNDRDWPPNGTTFAVYGFLEDSLGVRWIEPGDVGIACASQNPLTLETGASDWTPKLVARGIRRGVNRSKEQGRVSDDLKEFEAFRDSLDKANTFADDVLLWQKRMRMGGNRPEGTHSYTPWWGMYGKTHPEYFALNKFGKREPVPMPKDKGRDSSEEFIKMCPSSTGLVDQIVSNWLPKKDIARYISTGDNDGGQNFCECAACRALDVTKPGERFDEHLTDRYIYLANAVARKAKALAPDTWASANAYLNTFYPPRKITVEPNVLVLLVPYTTPLDVASVRDLFKGWYDAGARKLVLRPNYHTKYNTGVIPIGHEKQMFDVFQVAVKYGTVAVDYDSLVNNWPVTGMADYILARAMADPERPFEYWEDHYCSAYGPAAGDVRNYFRYWRNELWEKRLNPAINEIAGLGGAGDFVRGLMWSLGRYYQPADFDKTDIILQSAAGRTLTAPERDRLNQLVLANRHARLVYNAVVPQGLAKCGPARELLEFRNTYKDALRLRWSDIFYTEVRLGDITGLKLAGTMNDYLPPWLETDLVWRFKLDPEDAGLGAKWQEQTWEQTAGWEQIRTDKIWENQADETTYLSADTRNELPKYDGIAWYSVQCRVPEELKGRNIFLRFGAVDESCWVYINGKLAGQHVFDKGDDWKIPFEIRMDRLIDWNRPGQTVTVRVEDKNGSGGIWRPVWLVSKKSASRDAAASAP